MLRDLPTATASCLMSNVSYIILTKDGVGWSVVVMVIGGMFRAALPDVRLKPGSYGFQSVKTAYDGNLGRTPKRTAFR